MSYLIEWVTNIILFILLATVIDMLLPNSSMQKYVKMVTGLLLIAMILTPIYKLISQDFETALASIPTIQSQNGENMKNSIEMKKKEIQASEQAYILEQMAVQLKKRASEELMKQYGLKIVKVELSTNEKSNQAFPENLEKVSVYLEKTGNKGESIEAVKPIEINTNQPLSSNRSSEQTEKIVAFLSKKWDVDKKTIEILIEGGKDQSNG